MGLIGIKIRIATKEKLIPEFRLNESSKTETEEIAKTETEQIKTETEEIAKTETEQIKTETEEIAKTETEQIKIEEEKMKTLVTLEEEEEKLK
jgi:small subunit ribosomal protein S3